MPKEQKHDTFSALFAFRQHERAEHNTGRLIDARTALKFNPKKKINCGLVRAKIRSLKKTVLTDFGLYRPMGMRPRRHIFLPLQTCERTLRTKSVLPLQVCGRMSATTYFFTFAGLRAYVKAEKHLILLSSRQLNHIIPYFV